MWELIETALSHAPDRLRLVVSSRRDAPFGLVALEAMASGCPCLVADTGGLREVVPNEDVGLRFRSRDPGSLSTMAERLLTDTELRDRLVAEASEHVLTFDWADVARQVGAVYRELVRPPSLRSG